MFQLGKGGMRRMLAEMRADRFGDVVASCAMYRPGPLKSGMVRSYIARKHGLEAPESLHPALAAVFAPTYGVCIYQEQVMGAVRAVAGYSLAGADQVRKIIGKKKPELLAKERKKYDAGARAAGAVDPATAAAVWRIVEANASYSFNLAHATAYGLLAYRTAWLKAHHPAVFYASWLSVLAQEPDAPKKIAEAVYDAREHGVAVLPPCVLRSGRDFAPARLPPAHSRGTYPPDRRPPPTAVRYGLGGVRRLGEATVAQVLAARPFDGLEDFLLRVPAATKRDLAALAGAGALDVLLPPGRTRADLLASLDALLAWARAARKRAEWLRAEMLEAVRAHADPLAAATARPARPQLSLFD